MMNELLKQYLSEALSEETLAELSESLETAFTTAVDTKVEEQRQALVVEFAAQFTADRDALVEALDTKVEEMMTEELNELRESIDNFRDLEVEKAAELLEAKKALAATFEQDMTQLVERLDSFIELRLSEEMTELRESIEEVQKNNLGRKIFEAFRSELEELHSVENGVEDLKAQLAEAQKVSAAKDVALAEAKKLTEAAARKDKMADVLSSLQGNHREIMEAVLRGVPTEKLAEAYEQFIPRVLNEGVALTGSEKESVAPVAVGSQVLAEGEEGKTTEEKAEAEKVLEGKLISGDDEAAKLEESLNAQPTQVSESVLRLQQLAGIKGW